MNCIIRKATLTDIPAIFEMIQELADFENAPDAVTNTPEKMMSEFDNFHCFIAETPEDGIIGMALFYIAYYTWVGKSLYLDDLYVRPAFRGKKIGSMLLTEVIRIASSENCSRVRWQVLDWNKKAIAFYIKSGAKTDNSWLNCDFDEEAIIKYCSK